MDGAASPHALGECFPTHDDARYEQNEKDPQKQIEQYLGDARRSGGNAGKAERGGNERDDKKEERPFQQHRIPSPFSVSLIPLLSEHATSVP